MSGPKTSHYTLTPAQRRALEEQRRIQRERELAERRIREEQRKLKIEREKLSVLHRDAKSVIVEADRIIQQLDPLYAEIGADTITLNQAKNLRETVINAINQANAVTDAEGSAQLKKLNQELQAVTQKLISITKAVKEEHTSADKAFRAEVAGRIDGGFDFLFDTVGDTSNVSNSPFVKKIQSELDSLSSLAITDEHQVRIEAIQAKFKEIVDPDFLKNFYAMTVAPFLKECHAYHTAYTALGEEYERKLYIYEANAKKIGIATENIPFSTDAITILDAKIEETEEVIRHQDEQAYISQCVDEAMQEMGYSVAGNREVVRRNGKRFRNELYLFDEGTAVNVTYSSEGQITMELGGIGMDDRLPTEAESASLASDMRTFCDDYYEIERRLRKKGIVTKRISILPPDAQYAQIINVSDYNLSAEVSEYEAKGTKKQTAKAKTQRIGES